jgi:hypothetical protein
VRAYTRKELFDLFADLPGKALVYRTVYPGFDNVAQRYPKAGRWIRRVIYALETLPVAMAFGLSHFLVVRKAP